MQKIPQARSRGSILIHHHQISSPMAALHFLTFQSRLLFLGLLLAIPLLAQEEQWNELNAKVQQLQQKGRYSEALPLAQEALRHALAIFGSEHRCASPKSKLSCTDGSNGSDTDVCPA